MSTRALVFAGTLFFATTLTAGAEAMTESKKDEANNFAHRWNLEDIYASKDAWQAAHSRLEKRIVQLSQFAGHLSEGGHVLAACLENMFDMDRELSRIYSYASMLSDEDTGASTPLEMRGQAQYLATQFSKQASFVRPEILQLGKERVEAFLRDEPRLSTFAHYLKDIVRGAPHTLDTQGEQLLASSGLMSDAASSLYRVLSNAEIPWPTVTLSDGKEVRLDQAAYTRYRAVKNRDDRKAVFQAFWKKWKEYEQTMGVALYSQLKRDLFYSQSRKHKTCLAHALHANAIPEEVYHTLIQATHENLDTLHRYFRLRSRMLGIKDLQYHDIYPALVFADLKFPIEQGKDLVKAAVEPLGEEYVQIVDQGFRERWMDVYPRKGKRSGAYSNGAVYDVHPYVLMNYNDDYETVSTLAHEWGHAMHSYLANSAQPYPTADYSIFVAEVASTFNEALLLEHMLKNAKDDNERLYFLGSSLEGLRQTFFRQVMFAEFELAIHTRAEKGEALSGESFTKMYNDLLKKYHGHDEGVLTIDETYAVEWAYIPHFYYHYYVYQYATSLAAASLFADEVLAGKQGAATRFLKVLQSGGSEYPYALLKKNGVDLATKAPYKALIERMNRVMDQIEAILNRT